MNKQQIVPAPFSGHTQILLFKFPASDRQTQAKLESRGSNRYGAFAIAPVSDSRGSNRHALDVFESFHSRRPGQWWQNEIRRSRTRSKSSIFICTKRLSNDQHFQSKLDKQTFKI